MKKIPYIAMRTDEEIREEYLSMLGSVRSKIDILEFLINSINMEAQEIFNSLNRDINLSSEKHLVSIWLKPEECPFRIMKDHARLSLMHVGQEGGSWNCPFCNEQFNE